MVVYNEEFESYSELENIVRTFNEEIKNEVSQATNEVPLLRFEKEKEYLKPLPPMDMRLSYISCEKVYTVTKESVIKYEGKKYSVPTKYIGKKLNITETGDGNINIYYNNYFIVCHAISDKPFNHKLDHMHQILKSDACKYLSDGEITEFINENMSMLDILIGE